MANGLHKFYTSLADFNQKLIGRVYSNGDEDELKALTMEQLRKPMILIICLWGVATTIFLIEMILFKWNNFKRKRNRNRNRN